MRIREAQKHMEPKDPDQDADPQHWFLDFFSFHLELLKRSSSLLLHTKIHLISLFFGSCSFPVLDPNPKSDPDLFGNLTKKIYETEQHCFHCFSFFI